MCYSRALCLRLRARAVLSRRNVNTLPRGVVVLKDNDRWTFLVADCAHAFSLVHLSDAPSQYLRFPPALRLPASCELCMRVFKTQCVYALLCEPLAYCIYENTLYAGATSELRFDVRCDFPHYHTTLLRRVSERKPN